MSDPKKVLHSFEELSRQDSSNPNRPPNTIPAKLLDENWHTCLPAEQAGGDRAYDVLIEKGVGWELVPRVPIFVCENGQPALYTFFAKRQATPN